MELIAQSSSKDCKASKILRCMQWLQKQNTDVVQKQSVRDEKKDLKYIIQTNADREKFLLSVGGDEATVPAGAGEPSIKPKKVPLNRLRLDNLRIECEWQNCKCYTSNYELFQRHVKTHISDVHIIANNSGVEYACLWDACGYKSPDYNVWIRHINYHAYHARLLAIGFNGRATLNLVRCKKDSTKRNCLPNLPDAHHCMWTGCEEKFNSIQIFFDHVKQHSADSTIHLCSWAGCGAVFEKRAILQSHLRSHTNQRLIACFHCGVHFATNRKLRDHLQRQNVSPDSPYKCSMCGTKCATEYLLNEHVRQHVSTYLCSFCDMSAPSPGALANHVRYRHLSPTSARMLACTECTYRAVTKSDLHKHILTHKKKRKLNNSDEDSEDNRSVMKGYDSDNGAKVKKKVAKKYACHLCPEKQMKIFARGARLTKHLVKEHGAQWPFGHSRFRYQISEDGMYRLTTTRYEVLEVSEKIVDRHSGPKEFLDNKSEFEIQHISVPTKKTPRRFGITFKNDPVEEVKTEKRSVEIIMCDVDEHGNVIKSQVMNS